MSLEAVGLDDDALRPPEEVENVRVQPDLGLRDQQARLANQREETPLELRTGEARDTAPAAPPADTIR